MRCDPVIRPGFHPLSIGLMALGFIIAWPLGLAMLAYILWGDRLRAFTDGVRSGYERSRFVSGMRRGFGAAPFTSTGNTAFDAYRAAELDRLETERRRLEEERREFEAHLAHLRRARDQEEFDRFKSERAARRASGTERS